MRIKVSKKMCKELLKAVKSADFSNIQDIYLDTARPEIYERYINNNLFNALDYGDFDSSTGLIKFITVVYKSECYSVDRYFTTYDLVKEFKHSDKTLAGFLRSCLSLMEI